MIKTTLVTAPSIEPVTATECKLFMRVDSGTIGDDLTPEYTITPASIAANSTGAGVDVLGYTVLALLEPGAMAAGGGAAVKLQESDDNTTFTDVTSGAFTALSTGNQSTIQEKEYTGGKQYLRALATITGGGGVFGVTIVKQAPEGADDTLINTLIESARITAEQYTGRAFISQTWNQFFDAFPGTDHIELAYPPLLSVASVTYKDSDETINTFSTSSYHVDTDSEPGRVTLDYGLSWPSFTAWPTNPVAVQFAAGYGTTRASVPEPIRLAILYAVSHWYDHRDLEGELPSVAKTLLANYRMEWC